MKLSENDYWKSTLQSIGATLGMLSIFEGKHIEEIDNAITSLRKILAMGDDFDKAKRHPHQHQQQSSNNESRVAYHPFNEIAYSEDQYQRRLQRAIERSILEYNTQSAAYRRINVEYDYDEDQFEHDIKAAIELSLKDQAKEKMAHGTETTHGDATTSAEQENDLATDEKSTSDESTSNTSLKQANSVKISTCKAPNHPIWSNYDPLFESDDPFSSQSNLPSTSHSANGGSINKKATETKPELLLADLVFPTISAPVPVRHNDVPAILQAQEQKAMNVLQPQPSAPQTSNGQSQQPSYQSLRHYRQQEEQKQKRQRRYQQERLPQPVKFTPRVENCTTTASMSSSERSSPAIVAKAATGFEGKPPKMIFFDDLSNRPVLGSRQRVIEWVNDNSGAVSWNSFASSTDSKWKQGIDTEISDWEKEQARNQKTEISRSSATPSQGKPSVVTNKNASCLIEPADTCICDDLISIEGEEEEDNWTKSEEKPDTMVIFVPKLPIRKPAGPRIFHPDDGDFTSDDEDEDDQDNE